MTPDITPLVAGNWKMNGQREQLDQLALMARGVDDKLADTIQADAVNAHLSLGCRDMSRVDFILDPSDVPQVLEINTIPGFTSHSLLPMAAARIGISFEQMVDRIVEMAMQR